MERSVEAGRPGFLRGAGTTTVILWAVTAVMMAAAIYMIFLYAPTEAVQGDLQRLFYVHMSTALIGYVSFLLVFLGGAIYLARASVWWDRLARASAIIGVVFITIVLITGCLWGTKVWGRVLDVGPAADDYADSVVHLRRLLDAPRIRRRAAGQDAAGSDRWNSRVRCGAHQLHVGRMVAKFAP